MKKTTVGLFLVSLAISVQAAQTQLASQELPLPTAQTPSNQPAVMKPAAIVPSNTVPAPAPVITPATASEIINCNYRIPAETKTVEQLTIKKWTEQAVEQSFSFDPTILDAQLLALKACYTDQGWDSFKDALTKSGNLEAIKAQKLMVSSMVTGDIKVNEIKENQWKVNLPMQVVYQNHSEKLTQLLNIDLIIGRKVTGDLGIMQMIAVPTQTGDSKGTTIESLEAAKVNYQPQ